MTRCPLLGGVEDTPTLAIPVWGVSFHDMFVVGRVVGNMGLEMFCRSFIYTWLKCGAKCPVLEQNASYYISA